MSFKKLAKSGKYVQQDDLSQDDLSQDEMSQEKTPQDEKSAKTKQHVKTYKTTTERTKRLLADLFGDEETSENVEEDSKETTELKAKWRNNNDQAAPLLTQKQDNNMPLARSKAESLKKLIDKGAFAPKDPLKPEFYFHILDCRSRQPTTTISTFYS